MTKLVTLANKAKNATPLILPTGDLIPANGSASVSPANWEKAKDNRTVKAWIESGALVVKGGSSASGDGDKGKAPEGDGGTGNGGDAAAENEARLRGMSIAELTAAIEAKGGKDKVKSGMTKDEVVKIALEVGA